MVKKKDIQYCTEDVPYPLKAYVVALFCTSESELKIIWPLTTLQSDYKDIVKSVRTFQKQVTGKKNGIILPDICFVMPVLFTRKYPLRKEFWQKPSNPYETSQRLSSFVHAIDKPLLYSLLVTPMKYRNSWRYAAALPIPNSTSDSVIEQFMKTSDWPVEESAKDAAIYSFSTVIIYNWVEEREENIVKVQQEAKRIH